MRFARYVSVQIGAYVIDMGGFVLLSKYLLTPILAANIISKLCAGLFGFFVHRVFTFRVSDSDRTWRQAVTYFALLGLNLPLSAFILHGVLQVVAWPVLAKFFSDVICVFLSYWLSKRFVFL